MPTAARTLLLHWTSVLFNDDCICVAHQRMRPCACLCRLCWRAGGCLRMISLQSCEQRVVCRHAAAGLCGAAVCCVARAWLLQQLIDGYPPGGMILCESNVLGKAGCTLYTH